jgi:uncharacterized protein DUF4124
METVDVRIAGCALLMLVVAAAHGADVYRSTDANGTVSYSDRPQSDDAQPIRVAVTRPAAARSAAPAARSSADAAAPAAPAAAPGDPNAGIAAEAGPTPTQLAEQRAKNCTVARERQSSYSQAHRLYRALPNGEREYLSDSEIDKARTQAEADIKTWCG